MLYTKVIQGNESHLVHLGIVDRERLFIQGFEHRNRLAVSAGNEVGPPSAGGGQLWRVAVLQASPCRLEAVKLRTKHSTCRSASLNFFKC